MEDREPRQSRPLPDTRVRLRTLFALTMLLIASLGAGIAGSAAIKQQASTTLERRLAQAKTMEIAERLPLIDFSRAARDLQERMERHNAQVQLETALADASRKSSPEMAARHDLAAQEAQLKANALRPFVESMPNIINADRTPDERRLGLVAAGSLQRRGFQAQWIEGGAAQGKDGDAPRISYLEKDRLDHFDEQVLSLALVVVGLVVTLVVLTLADLNGRRRALAVGLYLLAVIGAAVAVGIAIHIDPDLERVIATVAGAFALLVGAAWMFGWLGSERDSEDLLQTQGIDQGGGFAGGSLQTQEAASGFSRHVVIWIALAALVSAVIGYWYTVAGSRGDDAAQKAYEQQIDVARRSGRATTAVISSFQDLADLYTRRAACVAAASRADLARRAGTPAPAAELDRELHCKALTGSRRSASPLIDAAELDRRFGPDADPRFPIRLQHHVTGTTPAANAAEALALWDGWAEIEAFWNAKTTSFLACLTIIAIALYVLGQALAMAHLRVARAMAACGIAMTLGALAWSGVTWWQPMTTVANAADATCTGPQGLSIDATSPPEVRMKAAAFNYARGSLGLGAADKEADFDAAITALECAARQRPTLALAYQDLAGAKALRQSAHKTQNFYSLPTKPDLDAIERDARAVIDIQTRLGVAANAYTLNSHAVALWGLGVRDGKLAPITTALAIVERAIALTEPLEADRQAVSRDPDRNLYPWFSVLPLLHLNHSLFLIANDRLDDGRAAAERALALGAARDWSLAASMITATGLLDKACDAMHSAPRCVAIRRTLASYAAALLSGRWPAPSPQPKARIEGVALAATPATVTLAVRLPRFDRAKDKLQMIWSVTDPQWGVPDVLSNVAPVIAPSDLRVIPDKGVYVQRRIMEAGSYRRCLSPGHYRAQIFLNGRLEGVASGELTGPQTTAARLDRLSLAFCHPATWKPSGPTEGQAWSETPMAGFVNGAGRPVAYLFSFLMEKATGTDAAAVTDRAVEQALGHLAEATTDGADIATLKARVKPCDKAGPGDLARAAGRSASGLVHVALIDVSALEGADACQIMNTITMMN